MKRVRKTAVDVTLDGEQMLWLILRLRELQAYEAKKAKPHVNSLRICGDILKTLEAKVKELP
jgi:hypothetical protein